MKKETMNALIHAGEQLGLSLNPRENYSGRGMSGKQTCAIVIETIEKLPALAAAAAVTIATHPAPEYDADHFVRDLLRLRTDSMGHDTVVY